MAQKHEIMMEYVKCAKNTTYTLKTYLETFDNTQNKFVPFVLFPQQETFVKNLDETDENIAMKYRQAGITTTVSAWASCKLAFCPLAKPEKILVIANKLETAVELATKIKGFLKQYPSWVNVQFDKNKNSQKHYKLENGCEVKAVATSVDALRGYTPTILIFDEAAYIEGGSPFWSACMASSATGAKIVVISTPNGRDEIYYEIYDQSVRGMNNFRITTLKWIYDPRFAKDLMWVKTDDILDYILNTENYNEKQILRDIPPERFEEILSLGYKPYSSWYAEMCRKLKFDSHQIRQELHAEFIGSGDNVIAESILAKITNEQIKEPIQKTVGNQLWIWKEPVAGHKYILAADISRGDSEDNTAFTIIDFDEREQVLEYVGKIPPDIAADIIYKWATKYSCFLVTDLTGGMGVATARKLQELGYKDFYYDGLKKDASMYSVDLADRIPGINFNSKRVLIIQALEEALRTGFIIRSERLLNELRSFIYINGRPDHTKSGHDDAIMALAMALYVAQVSFTQLKANINQAKAMIESVIVNETRSEPILPQIPRYGNEQSPITADVVRQNSWLFGGLRR